MPISFGSSSERIGNEEKTARTRPRQPNLICREIMTRLGGTVDYMAAARKWEDFRTGAEIIRPEDEIPLCSYSGVESAV